MNEIAKTNPARGVETGPEPKPKPPWMSGGLATLRRYFPGVMVSLTIAIAATFHSERYGGPVMLFALLLGMAFYFLSQEGACVAGIEFASKRILVSRSPSWAHRLPLAKS